MDTLAQKLLKLHVLPYFELFAMGSVQLSSPRRVAETCLLNRTMSVFLGKRAEQGVH